MNELLSYLNLCANVRGSVIRIPLRGVARNCSYIARNCAELCGIAQKLQGLQFRSSKINYTLNTLVLIFKEIVFLISEN